MEEDTAVLERLQLEKRMKMNDQKEVEMKLEREKKRVKKLDAKITSFSEPEIESENHQSESWTYTEVD